jgi:hypothetical protein
MKANTISRNTVTDPASKVSFPDGITSPAITSPAITSPALVSSPGVTAAALELVATTTTAKLDANTALTLTAGGTGSLYSTSTMRIESKEVANTANHLSVIAGSNLYLKSKNDDVTIQGDTAFTHSNPGTAAVTSDGSFGAPTMKANTISRKSDPASKVSFPDGITSPVIDTPSITSAPETTFYRGPGNRVYTTYQPGYSTSYALKTSDRRLKSSMSKVKAPLGKITRLKGVYFSWIREAGGLTNRSELKRQFGLIAQDVLDVLPEAVNEIGDGTLGVNYNAITSLLVEGMKDMYVKIHELERELLVLQSNGNIGGADASYEDKDKDKDEDDHDD